MRTIRRLWTRLFRGIYSAIANNIYEPLVVKTAFPLFGKDLPGRVVEQGRRAVASAGGGPILDLPVGTGYFAVDLATAHPGIAVGADVAWGMVERTKRTAIEAGANRLVPLQADGFHLPFADGTFASVVSSNGLQVMPDLSGSGRGVASRDGTGRDGLRRTSDYPGGGTPPSIHLLEATDVLPFRP